jgi:hypothetical protein
MLIIAGVSKTMRRLRILCPCNVTGLIESSSYLQLIPKVLRRRAQHHLVRLQHAVARPGPGGRGRRRQRDVRQFLVLEQRLEGGRHVPAEVVPLEAVLGGIGHGRRREGRRHRGARPTQCEARGGSVSVGRSLLALLLLGPSVLVTSPSTTIAIAGFFPLRH